MRLGFNDAKKKMMDLKQKILMGQASADEVKEHQELVKRFGGPTPALMEHVWPKAGK